MAFMFAALLLSATASEVPLLNLRGSRYLSDQNCIDSPQKWAEAFRTASDGCVAPNLFGAIGTGSTLQPDHAFAFLSGRTNLQNFLALNKKYHASNLTRAEADVRISAAAAVIVGFPRSAILPGNFMNVVLTVFDMPVDSTAFVPAWESLFLALENAGFAEVPFHVKRNLTLTYAKKMTPIESFSDVTGCKLGLVEKFVAGEIPSIRQANCSHSFIEAIEATGAEHPFGINGSTNPNGFSCFQNFFDSISAGKLNITATALRAAFFTCSDCNPLFSGIGLGFNNVASPLSGKSVKDQSFDQFFTGREFLVQNLPVQDVDHVNVELPNITLGSNVSFLELGFDTGL